MLSSRARVDPHGLSGYRRACRCVVCRAGHAAYVAARRRAAPSDADCEPARVHLRQLQALGLGTRQIARQAGVSRATVLGVLRGGSSRPAIVAKLLAARPVLAPGVVIVGTVPWRSIDSLQREGYTRRDVARLLGSRSQQLQLHRHLTVRSALRIARLYDALASEAPA